MKKHLFRNLLAAILGVILCCGLFCACNGKGGGGTAFAIEDMSVTYQERATIVPKSAPDGDIKYTFEGNNIRIQGNIVTGMKGNTETEVTATAANGATATFKVSVVFANPFGKNANTQEGDGVFTPVDETTFRKTSAEYGADYYYAGDNALTGAAYLFTGKLMLGSEEEVPAEGAYAAIILKESAEKTARFRFQSMGGGEYAVYSEYAEGDAFTGSEEIFSIKENELSFAVMVKDGSAYFYCNQAYVGKAEKAFSNVHVGIGGEKADVTASRLRSYTDEGLMEEYVELTKVVFGAHVYGAANSDTVFSPTSNPGEYQKTNQNYGQSFYYQDGIPVAGKAYSIKFTVKVSNPASSGYRQSTFMIMKDDDTMVRFALEYSTEKKGWYMFTDKKMEGTFGAWCDLGTITGDTATFKIVYNNNTCSFYQCNGENGESETLVKTVTMKNLGQTHFAFGGEKCTITLSNITAKRGA